MAHRQWMPFGRELCYSLKETLCIHEVVCAVMLGGDADTLKIGYKHQYTSPIQQLKFDFLICSTPVIKIMWRPWLQLACMLLYTKNIYCHKGNFTYFHYFKSLRVGPLTNQHGAERNRNSTSVIIRQRLCEQYLKQHKLCNKKASGFCVTMLALCSHKNGIR